MKFSIDREMVLKPLQQVAGVVERRQTLPILSNILMEVSQGQLKMTGTDLELELVAIVALEGDIQEGECTIPARKLVDICKSLPADAAITLEMDEQRVIVKSGRSRFTLSTLPASEFPNIDQVVGNLDFEIDQDGLRHLIESTAFSMAQQDVRYYLNGMLLEVTEGLLRSVSTDGHRLAMCDQTSSVATSERLQVIVPRKGILELSKLFADYSGEIQISVGTNHIRATAAGITFTSKLIDGKFPDYERVLPKGGDKNVLAERDLLKGALNRASILSNEKYRGIRMHLSNGLMRIVANNPEQEEADEQVAVDYQGADLEIGFNVSYLLDVLNTLKGGTVKMTLGDSNSSALVEDAEDGSAVYVVMPMRL